MNTDIGLDVTDEFSETTASALAAIGHQIREIRLARGMTLWALGKVSGPSPSFLSLVERGRASSSISSLIVISRALGVTMSDLVSGEPVPEDDLVVRGDEQQIVETTNHDSSVRVRLQACRLEHKKV